MQFDVAEQVSLLGEGRSTLSAVKRPLAWERGRKTFHFTTWKVQKLFLIIEFGAAGMAAPLRGQDFSTIRLKIQTYSRH